MYINGRAYLNTFLILSLKKTPTTKYFFVAFYSKVLLNQHTGGGGSLTTVYCLFFMS